MPTFIFYPSQLESLERALAFAANSYLAQADRASIVSVRNSLREEAETVENLRQYVLRNTKPILSVR